MRGANFLQRSSIACSSGLLIAVANSIRVKRQKTGAKSVRWGARHDASVNLRSPRPATELLRAWRLVKLSLLPAL